MWASGCTVQPPDKKGWFEMRTPKPTVVVLAAVAALLGVAPASPSNGPEASTVLTPLVDGIVTDTDADGLGDLTYDGAGSIAVGFAHGALEAGEHRGVFEFELATLEHRCIEGAQLLLNVVGSFGPTSDIPFLYPDYTLYAGTGTERSPPATTRTPRS